MGSSLIFRCKEHTKLEGHSSSLCQMDGKWRYPLPQCLAPCIVPHIARGHVYVASEEREHINNVTVAEHGKRLAVECVSDYEFAASGHPVLCNNGTWSIVPTCSPARCKQMPKPPKNGMVIAPKTDHSMKAVFKCKDGFELVGGGPYNNSYSVECQYGNWTGDVPHCVEVYCPFPGYVQNGKVLLVGNMGVYDYRPYVKKVVNNKQIMYDCDKGYYLSEGPPGATCIGGSWSPKELPKCTLGQHPRIRWNRRRRSVAEQRNETVVLAYRKFIEFFRKIGKKLLELEMEKSHEALAGRVKDVEGDAAAGGPGDEETVATVATVATAAAGQGTGKGSQPAGVNGTSSASKSAARSGAKAKSRGPHRNRARTKDERMTDFLRIVYRKLERIDSRHASANDTNVTMHELLNVMSKNFFHVDLVEPRRNASAKGHESYESKSQREFTKLKREFERIMRFYNKSLRWSEKHLRKDLRKKKKGQGHGERKKQHKSPNYYKGFYEFINDYVTQKLSALEAQNATDELIRKMKIDKISVRNGTMFTVGEIYTFFKHIIESKLNASKLGNESVAAAKPSKSAKQNGPRVAPTSSSPRAGLKTSRATQDTTAAPVTETSKLAVSENEIPALESENNQPKLRSKRIRDASTKPPPIVGAGRKLLSVDHPLGDDAPGRDELGPGRSPGHSGTYYYDRARHGSEELEPRRRGRSKRFLESSAPATQNHLKSLYLKAYEEEYGASVKRPSSPTNVRAAAAAAAAATAAATEQQTTGREIK
jgi:hypothetical protein